MLGKRGTRQGALALAALLGAAAMVAGEARAQGLPPLPAAGTEAENGDIVYTSADGLVQAHADGSDPRLLPGTAGIARPAFSFDGRKVAGERGGDIVLVDLASAEATTFAMSGNEQNAAFLPDGRVLFDRDGDIWARDVATGTVDNLTNSAVAEVDPSVSRDGHFIAVRIPSRAAVSLLDGGGDFIRDLADGFDPEISPDGSRVIYIRPGAPNEVRTVNTDGTGAAPLATEPPGNQTGPQWSPDGEKILFTSSHDGGDQDIFVANPDGSDATSITPDGDQARAAWQPIGVAAQEVPAAGRRTEIAEQAQEAAEEHESETKLTNGDELITNEVLVDPDGTSHVRLDRKHNGLRVIGGDLITHIGAGGDWQPPSLTLKNPLTLSTTPLIPRLVAETNALLYMTLQLALRNPLLQGDTELAVDASNPDQPRLVWLVKASGKRLLGGAVVRKLLTYDARTAALVRAEDLDESARDLIGPQVGGVHKPFAGLISIVDNQDGQGLLFVDPYHKSPTGTRMYGVGVRAGFRETTVNGRYTIEFTSNETQARRGVDVLYALGELDNYMRSRLGWIGPKGNGGVVESQVGAGGQWANNAGAGKTSFGGQLIFGTGGVGDSYTTMDIVAHEFGHLTSVTTPYSGETGGLNEANADIHGAVLEAWLFGVNANTWRVGEAVAPPNGHRRMWNPNSDGQSWSCRSQNGHTDPHYTSGPGNRWFYVASQGRNDPFGVAITACPGPQLVTPGIGWEKAYKIWWRALRTRLPSGGNYSTMRDATFAAARELYPDIVQPLFPGDPFPTFISYSPETLATIAGWDAGNVR